MQYMELKNVFAWAEQCLCHSQPPLFWNVRPFRGIPPISQQASGVFGALLTLTHKSFRIFSHTSCTLWYFCHVQIPLDSNPSILECYKLKITVVNTLALSNPLRFTSWYFEFDLFLVWRLFQKIPVLATPGKVKELQPAPVVRFAKLGPRVTPMLYRLFEPFHLEGPLGILRGTTKNHWELPSKKTNMTWTPCFSVSLFEVLKGGSLVRFPGW